MLTEEQNRLLTQVGPGTPMGKLLRRYWMPIAAVSEFERTAIKPVRLIGEDLVLYRDLSGTFGLVDRHCPHRRADLSYGFVEECGIRCNYHGWRFDESGGCREQPFEDTANPEARFRDKVRTPRIRSSRKAGSLWAYLGPQPAPLLPNLEPFSWKNGFVQIVFSHDPVQLAAVSGELDRPHALRVDAPQLDLAPERQERRTALPHLQIDFKEFECGFIYHRLHGRNGRRTIERWTVPARIALWPNCLGPNAAHRVARPDRRREHAQRRCGTSPASRANASPTSRERSRPGRGRSVDPLTGRS